MKTHSTEREKPKNKVQLTSPMLYPLNTKAGRQRWFMITICAVVYGVFTRQSHGLSEVLVKAVGMISIFAVTNVLLKRGLQKSGKRLIPEASCGGAWALLAMTVHLGGETRLQAREKLLELLPQLTEEANALTNVTEQEHIDHALSTKDKELVLALLSAVARIGNVEVISAVRALSRGKHLALTDPEVREAAALCLFHLEARLEQNQHNRVLLRPSVSPIEPETLLRPVVTALPEEPQVLLRSGEKPE